MIMANNTDRSTYMYRVTDICNFCVYVAVKGGQKVADASCQICSDYGGRSRGVIETPYVINISENSTMYADPCSTLHPSSRFAVYDSSSKMVENAAERFRTRNCVICEP